MESVSSCVLLLKIVFNFYCFSGKFILVYFKKLYDHLLLAKMKYKVVQTCLLPRRTVWDMAQSLESNVLPWWLRQ